jgi:hypothetical protein
MTLEPMTDELPVLTPRLPEPAVEVCFASRLTERVRLAEKAPGVFVPVYQSEK